MPSEDVVWGVPAESEGRGAAGTVRASPGVDSPYAAFNVEFLSGGYVPICIAPTRTGAMDDGHSGGFGPHS